MNSESCRWKRASLVCPIVVSSAFVVDDQAVVRAQSIPPNRDALSAREASPRKRRNSVPRQDAGARVNPARLRNERPPPENAR